MSTKHDHCKHLGPVACRRLVRPLPSQRGAVLITSLIFLIIMTLIGVTAMQRATLDERMAGNMHDRNLAFQAAESGLREAEEFLHPRLPPPDDGCKPPFESQFNGSNGLYLPASAGNPPHWEADSMWTGSDSRTFQHALDRVAEQPRYIIEYLGEVPPDSLEVAPPKNAAGLPRLYRITARGVGGSDTAVVVLQTTYKCP